MPVESSFLQNLIQPADTKIVMIIMDGLGGLPREPGGKTELETAFTPYLDQLAGQSACGLTIPVGPGITPGSGPGHLAIFGYDPIQNKIGRGALEALGAGFELGPDDVAARGNFCTVDAEGLLTDRRAGRLPTEESRRLVDLLCTIQVEGIQIFLKPIKEHRFAFVMRAPGLNDELAETDPLKTGVAPRPVTPAGEGSVKTAFLVNQFLDRAKVLLAEKYPANMILLRGFAKLPVLPSYAERFGLRAASIAIQGMYRGVSRLAGMDLLDTVGVSIADQFTTLERCWDVYDFFYLHVKATDTYGESGDFDGKVRVIEEVDALIPRLTALQPDVVIISGDHSSPAVMKAHSWHPVPTLVYSKYARPDGIEKFGERACAKGSLGILPAMDIMPIALANAGRIVKYGA